MATQIRPGYINRYTKSAASEPVMGDLALRMLYGPIASAAPWLLRRLASSAMSRLLAYLAFYAPWVRNDAQGFARANAIRLDDLAGDPRELRTRRDVFLRRIDYERCRPMPADERIAVSPADAKTLCGSLEGGAALPVKGRFFDLARLLGGRPPWTEAFAGADFVISRLAPPDYHWFHAPVSGLVEEVFLLDGLYYSVNPRAVRAVSGLLAKNARQIVILNSDAPGGTGVGRVAVIPVAAQVIGGIVLAYAAKGYEDRTAPRPGLFVERGRPLGFFQPGSSTVVTLFEKGRVRFAPDLLEQQARTDVPTLYDTAVFGRRLTEVAVRVRDALTWPEGAAPVGDLIDRTNNTQHKGDE